jgi:hypothetical protein
MTKQDQTESKIFAQIKQSLEQYEESYIPGSWEGFVQKRKQNKRRLLLRIASGIAACLLIGYIGTNLIMPEKREAAIPIAEQVSQPSTKAITPELKTTENTIQNVVPVKPQASRNKIYNSETMSTSVTRSIIPAETDHQAKEFLVVTNDTTNSTKKELAILVSSILPPQKNKVDSTTNRIDTIRKNTSPTVLDHQPLGEKQTLASITKRKIRFGVSFSPGVNTNQTTGSLNYMGGVSADIPLFSNFQLSTGLQLENQNFVRKIPGIVAASSAPQNETQSKLLNLDLPLNITWRFLSGKSNSYYVSTGMSSLVYLKQENKNTNYSQMLVPASSVVAGDEVKSYNVIEQVSVTRNSVDPVQTFDFAGRINIMVGIEKKLTDKIYLHIEPYSKIPTSGQSSGNLNHTTTGVNFKISF